jgi:Predicted transcriptional regulators
MDSKELGKKIKEARIAKKMTQSKVVGDFITRNMLSQIESGNATPSVKTLEYLSGVLDISMSQLVSEQPEDALPILERAKKLLRDDDNLTVMEMETDYPEQLKDEFAAIFSKACLKLSKERISEQDYIRAMHYAQKAMEYADMGIYSNAAVKSESLIILTRAAQQVTL